MIDARETASEQELRVLHYLVRKLGGHSVTHIDPAIGPRLGWAAGRVAIAIADLIEVVSPLFPEADGEVVAETYYSKGKDADWFERLSDKDAAWALSCAAMDLNDTGLGDEIDKWMPHNAMLSGAGDRIQRLVAAREKAEQVAAGLREDLRRLVAAAGRARVALAGYLDPDQAAFELDVAMPTSLRASTEEGKP